jgi:hypothetical protein
MDLIIKKYGLSISCPLLPQRIHRFIFIVQTNLFYSAKATKLTIKSALGSLSWYDERNQSGIPSPKKYSVSSDLTAVILPLLGFRRSKTRANTLSFNYKILLTG